MAAVIESVLTGSVASGTIIRPGDTLKKINGNPIADILDYRFFSYDSDLMMELTGVKGELKLVRLRKREGADTGLEFETYLMDKQRSCANKCIFCFIDQLPEGMRETLYYKDDDVRLSFLQGNYVTLTNLSPKDIDRIIRLRISPINVSVHSLDPAVRAYMLGSDRAEAGINALMSLAGAGIVMNCQIVCCPGINDGAGLRRTMEGLLALGGSINSVSVVPVGLTRHRSGLEPLRQFDRELALKTVRQVERLSDHCLGKRGSRVFFCADELYMNAGLELPRASYYEDYPQLENGVGMMRLFISEFERALVEDFPRSSDAKKRGRQGTKSAGAKIPWSPEMQIGGNERLNEFSVVTGYAAGPYIENLLMTANKLHDRIQGKVFAVRNDFFGAGVTVSGLLTGGDIITQLRGNDLGSRLLIPQNMLRSGENTFLDDITVPELSEALGIKVRIVRQDGADLAGAFMGN